MSLPGAGAFGLAFAILCLAEGVGPRELLRDSVYLLWLGAMAFFLECLSFTGGPLLVSANLIPAALYTLRLAAAFFAGRLFYASTPGPELRRAALAAGGVLPRRLRAKAALAVVLVLGFIPLILSEWKATLEAARARGFGRGKPLASVNLVVAFMRRLMLDSVALPEVLASRGWYGGEAPPRAREVWGPLDLAATGLCLGFLALAAATPL